MGEINLRLSCYLNEVFFMDQSRMSFSEYLLCESIKIIPVKYGLNYPDFDDKRTSLSMFLSFHTNESTVFKMQNYAFVLDQITQNGVPTYILRTSADEIGAFNNTSTENILQHNDFTKRKRARTLRAMEVIVTFSTALSIAIELSTNLKKFQMSTLDSDLTRFYDMAIKNQNLINSLKQYGWSVSKESDHYVFIKE